MTCKSCGKKVDKAMTVTINSTKESFFICYVCNKYGVERVLDQYKKREEVRDNEL